MDSNSQNAVNLGSNPPFTNRGVTTGELAQNLTNTEDFSLLKNSFFDWYQATIEEENIDRLMNRTLEFLEGSFKQARPRSPYDQAIEFHNDGESIYTASFGGVNKGIFIVSSSSSSEKVSQFIRSYYKDHRVSRFDTAIDFDREGSFEALSGLLMDFSREYDLKVNQVGDWRENGTGGRTLYLGSRKSVAYLRLYEKGKEQISKGLDIDANVHWCRLELEIKPANKVGKETASSMEPYDAFSVSRWTRALAELLDSQKLEPKKLGTVRKSNSDLDMRISYMLYQYGVSLEDVVDQKLDGNWDELGSYLKEQLPKARNLIAKSKSFS